MNGSAPKLPATGSHVLVVQNFRKPNCLSESSDSLNRTKAMPATSAMMTSANVPVPAKNSRSGRFVRRSQAMKKDAGASLLQLDLSELSHFELHDRGRHRRVAEIRAVLLSVGQRPLDEVGHRFGLGLILRRLIQQQPRKGRDRVRGSA